MLQRQTYTDFVGYILQSVISIISVQQCHSLQMSIDKEMQTGLNFSTNLKFSFIVSCLFKQNSLNILSNISFSSNIIHITRIFISLPIGKIVSAPFIFNKNTQFNFFHEVQIFSLKYELNLRHIDNYTLINHLGDESPSLTHT